MTAATGMVYPHLLPQFPSPYGTAPVMVSIVVVIVIIVIIIVIIIIIVRCLHILMMLTQWIDTLE